MKKKQQKKNPNKGAQLSTGHTMQILDTDTGSKSLALLSLKPVSVIRDVCDNKVVFRFFYYDFSLGVLFCLGFCMSFCLFVCFHLNSKYNTQILLTGRPILFLMPDILPELYGAGRIRLPCSQLCYDSLFCKMFHPSIDYKYLKEKFNLSTKSAPYINVD